MPGAESPQDLRRSSRISITIPLELRGENPDGTETRAAATTKYVNKHGALLLTEQFYPADSDVTIYIPHFEREQLCRVVWVSEREDKAGLYSLGIALQDAENFWGVQFPPDDWIPSTQAPLAGEPKVTAVSPNDTDEQERRTLRSMVNALVAVLEEKGVLTRAELAECFQRLNRADAAVRAQAEERPRSRSATP